MAYSKCKNCGGEEIYNPDTGMLNCERCGSSFLVKENNKTPVRRMYDPSLVIEENKDIKVVYKCSTCGTQSIVGLDKEVKRCSSCGNTTLTQIRSNLKSPDGIIPFEISRNKAAEIFRKWVGSRKFAPSDLRQMARLKKISGIYTPVFNFDYISLCKYSVTAIKKNVDSDGNETRKEYQIQKTKEDRYEDVLRTASSRISDNFILGLGEYNYNKLRPYSTDYLLGFAGIDTDLDIHKIYRDMYEEISEENKSKIENRLKDDYDYLNNFNCITRFKDVSFNYSYLPIWANHYTYKGKEYHCYINGQTGKATGSAPKSILKIGGLVLGILAGIGLGILIIASLI